jgi:predicted DNA-binding transcriptional regulator AlpA
MESQFLGPSGQAANAAPLLLSADDLAIELSVSARTISRLASAGKLPKPVRLGRSVRWRQEEIIFWLASGCADRQMLELMKGKSK